MKCKDCTYYEAFTGACFNGNSENCGGFMPPEGGCKTGKVLKCSKSTSLKKHKKEGENKMNDIIQKLKHAYSTDKAETLNLLPQLFNQYDDGLIKVLPCKPNDTYWHRDYMTGELELNIEMHSLEDHDSKYREKDCCAFWE